MRYLIVAAILAWSVVAFGGPQDDVLRAYQRGVDSMRVACQGTPPDTIIIPPPPPPSGSLAGGDPLSGFWTGWRGRTDEKFGTAGDYGWMGNNTNGSTKMGLAERGFVEFEVYYDTEIHPGYGGGQHLFAVSSQNAPQAGPYDPEIPHLNGWYKVDFSPRESDQLRGVLYYDSDPGAGVTLSTIFLGTWPLRAWRTWGHLRVEWEQSPQRTLLRVNGRQVEVPAFNGMSPLGNLLVVGNMDRNSGERCVGYPRDPCGTLGKIRYRGFQWGR